MRGKLCAAAIVIVMLAAACTGDENGGPAGGSPMNSASTTVPPTSSASTSTSSTPSDPSLDTSAAKIETAESAGRITAAVATMYRVFAVHADDRLPTEFRAGELNLSATQVMDEANGVFADPAVPAATRAAIKPYLVPPPFEESWARYGGVPVSSPSGSGPPPSPGPVDPDKPLCSPLSVGDWKFVEGASSPVRVWWHDSLPARAAYAAEVRDEMDRSLWKNVTDYFGHGPLTDDGICSLGGKRLDIYLLSAARGIDGATVGIGGGSCRSGLRTYIELSVAQRESADGRATLLSSAAHELAHAVLVGGSLAGSDCRREYGWLEEATARWVEQWAYPAVDGERQNDGGYAGSALFQRPSEALEVEEYSHSANVWVYLLYLQHVVGEGVVRSIWENAVTSTSSIAAVNGAAPFRGTWPGFARALWNQNPVTEFQQWDHLTYAPAVALTKTVSAGDQRIPLDTVIPQRSTRFYRFLFPGSTRQAVTLVNGLSGTSNASVQVLAKQNGSWGTAREVGAEETFCRPPLEELVVIVANTWEQPGATILPAPARTYLELGDEQKCARWSGQVTSTRTWTTQTSWPLAGGGGMQTVTQTVRYTGTVGSGDQRVQEGEVFVPPDSNGIGVRFGPSYTLPVTWQARLTHTDDTASHTETTGRCRPSSLETGTFVTDFQAHDRADDTWSDSSGAASFWMSREAGWLRIRPHSSGHEFVVHHRDRTISSSTCSGSGPGDTGWHESDDRQYAPGPESTIPVQKQGPDPDNQSGSVTTSQTMPDGSTVQTTVTWDLHRISR
jgi:hypothetical protein